MNRVGKDSPNEVSEERKQEQQAEPLPMAPGVLRDLALAAGQPASAAFWGEHEAFLERAHVDGEFWSEVVKRLKRERKFEEALRICEREMPLPGAYEHALICLRKIYQRDKSNLEILRALYECAVEADIMCRIPCVEIAGANGMLSIPGYNVAVLVHRWLKESPRQFAYAEFGFRSVRHLNKTDRSRLVAAYGEPRGHKDSLDAAADLWDRGAQEVAARHMAQDLEFRDSIQGLMRGRRKDRES